MQKDHLKCPACGSMNPPDVDRCEICGSLVDIEEEEKQVLDNLKKIPDIGRKRAERVIISGFSRVKDLEEADRDDFASIERIGRATAEKIYRFLQDVKDERGKLKLCSECGSLMGAAKENCPKCDGGQSEKKKEDFEMQETLNEAEEKTTEETTEEKASKTCSVCGTSLEAGQETCPVCGTSFAGEGTSQKEIRKE
ncbi:MAG: helix-hairpin-helix domain-containing protein, partial [Candidatus Thermoplasmatota archaeon]